MEKHPNKYSEPNMFKQRLFTALILIPIVLGGLYYANSWVIKCVALLALIGSAIEWQQLIPLKGRAAPLVFFTLLILATTVVPPVFNIWLIVGLGTWALICMALIRFPQSQTIWGYPAIVAGFALILLPLFAESLVLITQESHGKVFLVTLLFMVWGADTGGYVIGKMFGHHHLIPQVSPGKTIQGTMGGALFSLIVAAISFTYLPFEPQQRHLWFAMTIFVFFMALIGDLFISMLKRRVHIKDTGTLFPGHGGVLDRLDSLIAAAPAFYFGLHWIRQGAL